MDRDLVAAARRGDQAAFMDLVRPRSDRLFSIALQILRAPLGARAHVAQRAQHELHQIERRVAHPLHGRDALENSIDKRVLEIFERKLNLILAQLGVDKRDDILHTISRASALEDLVATAIADPEHLEEKADELEANARDAVESEDSVRSLLGVEKPASPRSSDAAEWSERAVAEYQSWSGRSVDGIADLLSRLPEAPAPEAVPMVRASSEGVWSLWEVSPDGARSLRDYVSIFVSAEGSLRPDIADRLWTALAEGEIEILGSEVLVRDQRSMIESIAADHAYRACQALQPEGDWIAPVITPRLVVRAVS